MDNVLKLKHTIDALFGSGVSKFLPKNIEFTFSRKNGRIREVYHKKNLLCTLRIDGGLAISPFFAKILLKSKISKKIALRLTKNQNHLLKKENRFFANMLFGVVKIS